MAVREGKEDVVGRLTGEIRAEEHRISETRGVMAAQERAKALINGEIYAARAANPRFFRARAREASQRVREAEQGLVDALANLARADTDASAAWKCVFGGPRGGALPYPAADFDGLRLAIHRVLPLDVVPKGETLDDGLEVEAA
ncbi:MAG: hypothetical protein ACR2KV_14065 [Solirubrobacteraceae bacterium]